ncbi:MAG: hypothetical protein R3D00_23455 [Bacteroidia bacterium]
MRTIGLVLALVSILFEWTGCAPAYGPAISGNNFPYQARAIYSGTDTKQNWVSGSIHNGIEYQPDEESFFAQVQLHQAYSTKNLRTTYGGFLYGGSYDMQRVSQSLSYFGGGVRGSACVTVGTPRFEYHIVGIQAGWATEFGAFSRWREEQAVAGLITNINENKFAIPTMNFFTGFSIKSASQRSCFGMEMALGSNGIPFTFHYTSGRINSWLQLNLGLIDENANPEELPPAGFGIGFRL